MIADAMRHFGNSVGRRALMKTVAAASTALALPRSVRTAGAQETLKIAFSVPSLGFFFFANMMDRAQAHASQIGGIELIPLDGQEFGNPSVAKQSADLRSAIELGIDGVVISPEDAAALVAPVQEVIDAGIPVVTVDRNLTGAATLAHVGVDNVEGGRLQGRYLLEILPEGGDVFELQGLPGVAISADRHAGLDEIIKGQDKVKIVASETAQFDYGTAVAVTRSLLSEFPEPKAVVAANDGMAFGAIEALTNAGLSIPVVGFDAITEALIAIKDGRLAATIDQYAGRQAARAIDILVAKLRDGRDPQQHDNFVAPALITRANLSDAEGAAEAGIVPSASPSPTM